MVAKHPQAMKRAATTTATPLPYEGSRHQTLSAYIQARFDEFSRSQKDVAQYIVDGPTHKEIGAQLYISPKTVEHHVAKIRQKLGASTRAEMLAALRSQLAS